MASLSKAQTAVPFVAAMRSAESRPRRRLLIIAATAATLLCIVPLTLVRVGADHEAKSVATDAVLDDVLAQFEQLRDEADAIGAES